MTILTCEFFKMDFIGLVDILCTVALVLIYFRQMNLMKNQKEIQDKQLEIQRNSIDLGPAQLIQNLYSAFQNYHHTIMAAEWDLLMPAIDFRIECGNRMKGVGEANANYAQEIEKLRFLVSPETYKELNSFFETAKELTDNLFNSLAPALCSYETTYEYTDEFDLLQRGYQETGGAMPVDDYMDGMVKLDDHKSPYLNYKQLRHEYDTKYNVLLDKFQNKFGFGNLL